MKTRAEKLAIYGNPPSKPNHASHKRTGTHPREKEQQDDNPAQGISADAHNETAISNYDKSDDSQFEVTVEFTFSDNRRRDLENCVSTVLDVLCSVRRLLAEDSARDIEREKMSAEFRRLHDHNKAPDANKANPRTNRIALNCRNSDTNK